jgi:hypothetical protein
MLPATRFLVWDCVPWWESVNKQRYNATVYRTPDTDVYVRHNEYVRKLVPKDQLLEFRPEDGWKPLCEFLGVPVPDQPYPRMYETKEQRKFFNIGAAIGVMIWLAGIGGCYGVWYAANFLWARSGRVKRLEL